MVDECTLCRSTVLRVRAEEVFAVQRFVEKPNLLTAEGNLSEGGYL